MYCEEEIQNWDFKDTFALTDGVLNKALVTVFPKKKSRIEMKRKTMVELQITLKMTRQKDEVLQRFPFSKDQKLSGLLEKTENQS